jgi:hypothetical protein
MWLENGVGRVMDILAGVGGSG